MDGVGIEPLNFRAKEGCTHYISPPILVPAGQGSAPLSVPIFRHKLCQPGVEPDVSSRANHPLVIEKGIEPFIWGVGRLTPSPIALTQAPEEGFEPPSKRLTAVRSAY